MKHLLITTIAAVLLVGCGESKQSSPPAEAEPAEPVVEAAKPEPTGVKAPDISIHAAARQGKIEAVKQHLTDGVGVNAKSERGMTPLHSAAREGHKEVVELLIANGADVNPKDMKGQTPLDMTNHPEIADLLRKHGGKTGDELKAEGK
jgi:ankyrin repeat protein